ncbi:hypothetical protein F5Y15DRAFT_404409 [Xylariaceae sp. FL0016]|nr:hypothetical protein F5Y15DRAFT_404409 [Xylariaceae sp. FL0016]
MAFEASDLTSEDGVKLLSQLLRDAGVSAVLWGDYLLNVYGVVYGVLAIIGVRLAIPLARLLLEADLRRRA